MISFQYKVFYEVAKHLSFSKAADSLFISQPAVSKHVKNLEIVLGTPLFERKGSSISLTSLGEKLMEHLNKAKNIERLIQSDVNIIKGQNEAKGELRVGASTTASLYVLPKVLSAFHKKYPNIKLLLINRNSENILKALANKEIDIAIIEGRNKPGSFRHTFFMEDEIIAVCSTHSSYSKSKIEVSELKNIPLVMRERGSGALATISYELDKKGIKLADLKIIARLGGTEALKNYLLVDEAVGFLSRLAIVRELEANILREIQINNFKAKRKFYFVLRQGEETAGIIKSLIELGKATYN